MTLNKHANTIFFVLGGGGGGGAEKSNKLTIQQNVLFHIRLYGVNIMSKKFYLWKNDRKNYIWPIIQTWSKMKDFYKQSFSILSILFLSAS